MNTTIIETQTKPVCRHTPIRTKPSSSSRDAFSSSPSHTSNINVYGAPDDTDVSTTRKPNAAPDPPLESLHDLESALCNGRLGPKQLGACGERYAATWLEERGWQVLERNWACRYGELDIIMRERDGTLVFVEVKTRRTLRYGTPQEAVTRNKQLNLHTAALLWLSGPGKRIDRSGIRFDVMSLWIHEGHVLTHWIPGAF